MLKVNNPPSVTETAFVCPFCGAFTSHKWYATQATAIKEDQRTPRLPAKNAEQIIEANPKIEPDKKNSIIEYVRKLLTGRVFLEQGETHYSDLSSENLFLSECFNCNKIAVWVHETLVFPSERYGVEPNSDLPDEIAVDFEEARTIVNLSPRAASALLRLCIQKLCKHLGQAGKNIDTDIAALVALGLNPLIQKSLDIVRVIGNEAVHPGTMDLKDDKDTAFRLLELVNSVADQMISHPKQVNGLYQKLPKEKRKAIEKRDSQARNA